MTAPFDLRETSEGVLFTLRVQPRSSREGLVGVHDGALRLRTSAPPVDGAANDAVVRLLADALGVPRRAVRVITGATSRHKTVLVAGVTANGVREALDRALSA